jgi:alpha-tubulin suppressor-like RCC1 family protein
LTFPERPVFIAAGCHFSAVITEGGALYMGGENGHGELGTEVQIPITLPSRVLGLPLVVEVAMGWYHTVARTEEGAVWSWGRNDSGEAGHGPGKLTVTTPSLLPPFTEKIVRVVCGGYHSFFLGEKGTIWSCGWNYYGNTGLGEGERATHQKSFSQGREEQG